MAEHDAIAVIGTGVVGASVGYRLAAAGVNVLLVDAGHPGGLTTSASFAWVNASAKAQRGTYFELNVAGLKEYERLAAELPDRSWWSQTGHLRWDYPDEPDLRGVVDRLASLGYPAEVWEADRARRLLEPELELSSPSGLAVLLPDEGWVDGPRLVRALVDAASGAATAFGRAVRSIDVRDRAVVGIELDGGERVAVGGVVNAAGPAAGAVAELVGRNLPMKDSPGLVVRAAVDGEPVRRVIHAPGVSIRPDGPGRVLVLCHSVEPELRRSGHASAGLVEEVLAAGSRVLPALGDATVTDARVGRRPIPADDLPSVGGVGEVAGYYEAVMHSGITLGPFVGRALAAEIVEGRIDPLLAGFRAGRFGEGRYASAAVLRPAGARGVSTT